MRAWLERVLPGGPWQPWLAGALEGLGKAIVAVLLFLLIRWLAARALHLVMVPLRLRAEGESGQARVRTLEGLARSALTYLLLLLAAITLLSELGVNVAALLAGAGVAGLALSFGAQRLVRDVLTGFFMLLEDQCRVGEVVTLIGSPGLPQITGRVEEMGLRIARLLDQDGKWVTVANGDIAAIVNHSRGPVLASVEIGIAPETSLDHVRDLAARIQLPDELFSGPATVVGVTALEAERTAVRLTAPARPGLAPEAELHLRQAAGEALRAAGVGVR